MNPVQRTRDTNNTSSSIVKFAVLDGIASLMLGLGIYAKFGAQGDAFHPFLNDSNNVNTLIVIGTMGTIFCVLKIVMIVLKRDKLKREGVM